MKVDHLSLNDREGREPGYSGRVPTMADAGLAATEPLSAQQDKVRRIEPMRDGHLRDFIQSGSWEWPDSGGNHINAHGSGFLFWEGTYYWYGEYKFEGFAEENGRKYGLIFPQDGELPLGLAQGGFSCYSSKDLMTWRNEGLVLGVVRDDPDDDLAYGGIFERPKVVHNSKTGKFVMHFKLKSKPGDRPYAAHGSPMYFGVAVADKPTGPFVYSHKYLYGGELGAGDLTIFIDDDGQGYIFAAKKPEYKMGYMRLSDDYMNVTGAFTPVCESASHFEAPAVFKHNGTRYLWGSGTKGYHPTVSKAARASSIVGPWTLLPGGFARGGGDGVRINDRVPQFTYGGQITYVLPVPGKQDAFIAMMDQWRPTHPFLASYIWLPVQFSPDGEPYLEWLETWDFSRWRRMGVLSMFEPEIFSPNHQPQKELEK